MREMGAYIGGLDMVFVLLDPLLQFIDRYLLILNDEVNLELFDTEADGDEGGGSPDKTVNFDGSDVGLELLHVRLVIL